MGCYLVSYYASTVEHIVASVDQSFHGTDLLVAGNFNTDLVVPKGNARDEEIVA